jgi:hypothetical protein
VFDPARDDDRGKRRFYTRLLAVFALGSLMSVALWPSVTGFTAGPDADHPCIALADAWRSRPDAAACQPESRRRVLFTAAGLGAIGVAVTGTVLVRARHARRPQTRTNLRHSGAWEAPS